MKLNLKLLCCLSLLFVILNIPLDLAGQTPSQLKGKIFGKEGKGLPGVTIAIKGGDPIAATDESGDFRLPAQKNGTVLVFTSIGYDKLEYTFTGQSDLELTLQETNSALGEVIVIGYGTKKKSDLTGSVASIRSEDLQKQGPRINFLQSLQGAAPGLNITQTGNSASSAGVGIDIRGQNSIAASNTPLFILDGVPYSGALNNIDQSMIESVEVLKDASSAAIYGARGANGVIIITTKRGKSGKPLVSYEGSFGWKEAYGIPRLLNGEEHWNFGVERYGIGALNADSTRKHNHEQGLSTDWVDEATQIGKQQKHAISLSGGAKNFSYLVAGNYAKVQGIAKGDDYTQSAGRVNLSVKPTDWLEIGTNSQYTSMNYSGVEVAFAGNGSVPYAASSLGGAFYMNPLVKPRDANGNLLIVPWKERPTYPNPLAVSNTLDEDFATRFFSNNYLTIKLPVKGLSYKLNTGYTFENGNRDLFWGPNTIEGIQNNGQAYSSTNRESSWLIENLLFYDKSFGDHKFNVTALYSSQKNKYDRASIYGRGFPTEVLTWYQPGSAGFTVAERSFVQESYLSQMGRLFYSFKDKYLVTGTVRRDGYSAFGSERKFGVFPSVALGWNIHMEDFMNNVKWLEQLKLRLSYGRNGNQAISAYSTMAKMVRSDYLTGPIGNQQAVGYLPNTLENALLGWEVSETLNLGIDFSLFKNRLSGSVDFYEANTSDLLLNRAISSINGVTSVLTNIGKVRNTGIEVNLNSKNIVTNNFEWTTMLNISHNRNEILDLYGNGQDDVANGWFIGKPVGVNFGYQYAGVWQTSDDIARSSQPTAKPGDVKVKDVDGDGKITPADRTIQGQTAPKLNLGLNNQFRYKQFTLNVMITARTGVTRLNPYWDTDIVFADAVRNTLKQNWWSAKNPTNDYPANRDGTNAFNVRFYNDASFVRINNISLSYDVNRSALEKMKLSRLMITAGLINGFTFTSWNGLDPEYTGQFAAPFDRIYNIGLNLTF